MSFNSNIGDVVTHKQENKFKIVKYLFDDLKYILHICHCIKSIYLEMKYTGFIHLCRLNLAHSANVTHLFILL